MTDALHLYRWLRSLLAKRVLAPFCLRSSANRNREFSSPLVTASSTVWKVSWRAQRRRTYTRKNRCVSRMSHQALVERACAAWWRERERERRRTIFRGTRCSRTRGETSHRNGNVLIRGTRGKNGKGRKSNISPYDRSFVKRSTVNRMKG